MPRTAHAIIALAACSASCLSPDSGVALRCVTKSKRNRALTRRTLSKHAGRFIADYEAEEDKQDTEDETIFPQLAPWQTVSTDIEALAKVQSILSPFQCNGADVFSPSKMKCKVPGGSIASLPEDLFLAALQYTGIQGRTVSRRALQCCNTPLRESLQLPTFPVTLCVKQHYHFGPRPVTSKWSLDVSAPTESSVLEVCTESADEEHHTAAQQYEQPGSHMLRVCRELRQLQTKLGPHYREDGRTQVEVLATDAAGRTLLDHSYEYQTFCNKADDLLELLAETDFPVPSAPTGVPSRVSSGTRRASARPIST